MLAFACMLLEPARQAGMIIPPEEIDVDMCDDKELQKYPHFFVFCQVQLGKRMHGPTEHWENAKIIAEIPDDSIRNVTIADLIQRGLSY